jgi:hypothetical protein
VSLSRRLGLAVRLGGPRQRRVRVRRRQSRLRHRGQRLGRRAVGTRTYRIDWQLRGDNDAQSRTADLVFTWEAQTA